MSRTTTLRMTTCALMLALPLGLTACGNDKGDTQKDGAQATANAANPSDKPTSPVTSQSAAPESSAPESSAPESAAGGDNSGKPAKGDVKAGLKKYYDTQPSAKSINTQKLADCMVDKGYNTFSAKTLTAMMNGDGKRVDPKDTKNIVKFSGECATTIAKVPSSS